MTTETRPERQTSPVEAPLRAKRVAIMPAYNEEATIVSVLQRLEPLADELIVVDDGSTDRTRYLVLDWAAQRPNVRLICFNQNRGMSAAYYRAFQEVARRVDSGDLSPNDVILTVDADGQHDPAEVDALVEHLQANHLDALIARRDLSIYTPYKRAGNFLMSLWASLWAGVRLYDVESGYRAFRAGPLLTALHYYKGYRYSETVEVAVILARLGFRVDNNYLVPVPVYRSNTRLKDLVIDIAAIPAAAWRLEAKRAAPAGVRGNLVYYLPLLGPMMLALMAIDVLGRSLFLANDSMQHYAHVWYLSTQLFQHARLPLHMSVLDSGQALTFPYGFAPYLAGALLYPLLGDWAVTLLMVVAFLAAVWAAGLARPVMRDPWLLLLFVLNPAFIDSLYSFQLASLWSIVFFYVFVWAFDRRSRVGSAVYLWLAIATHPIVGGAAAGGYGVYLLLAERESLRRYAVVFTVALLASAPFLAMTLSTPALAQNLNLTVVLSTIDTVLRRSTVTFLPLLAPFVAGFVRRHYLPVLAGVGLLTLVGVGFSAGLVRVGDLNRGGYPGAFDASTNMYGDFFASTAFAPGATYRVVEPTDREDGVYRFLRHGAVISNEFFSEAFERRDWTEPQLACYASFKGIDYDVTERAYDQRYHKDETALLQSLAGEGRVSLAYNDPAGRFAVYDLRSLVSATPKPQELSACGL